jgi:nicotinamide mononucleotide adenylyltransferase
MTAANDNRAPLSADERAAMVEAILEEFDLLCLGIPTPDRLEREIAARTLH